MNEQERKKLIEKAKEDYAEALEECFKIGELRLYALQRKDKARAEELYTLYWVASDKRCAAYDRYKELVGAAAGTVATVPQDDLPF